MTEGKNRQWILNARPVGKLTGEEFRWNEGPVPQPSSGQVLIRTLWLSLALGHRIFASSLSGEWLHGAEFAWAARAGAELLTLLLRTECLSSWRRHEHGASRVGPYMHSSNGLKIGPQFQTYRTSLSEMELCGWTVWDR